MMVRQSTSDERSIPDDSPASLRDALMAQGDERGAIRKIRAAADRAPQWGALHLARGRALEADGKRDEAREKYTEAARMNLAAADRAEMVRRMAAVNRGS
ncbi:hypothetical protein [Brevundimonas sp. DC300-4]|uniref:hypothetical protein n=1 Tax=Brevundimonas sp. DC300-4 TaxID=2804594 RepID=UPI003CF5F060